MNKPLLYIAILFFILLIPSQHVYADLNISIAPGLAYFHYEEFDENKNTLNKETGFIPGISLSLQHSQHSLGTHIFDGDVDYDGQTQAGSPHKTDTDESLYYLFYRYNFLNHDNDSLFFIGANYQLWQRFIKANNGVNSLYEEYSWWHIEAGIQLEKILKNNSKIKFEFAGLRTFNGNIMIDLQNFGYGEANLDLGSKNGIRSLLALNFETDNSLMFSIGVEHKYWEFGKSNTTTLSNGTNSISILEPDSESNLTRFFIQFTQTF